MEKREFIRRAVQGITGSMFFELPGLRSVRSFAYRKAFPIGRAFKISAQTVFYTEHGLRGELRIGDHVSIGAQVLIDYSGDCDIGDNVWISHRAAIFTHEHRMTGTTENIETLPTPKKLTIENNAWIGYQATILPNVSRIGKGAIIGAGSVVTKDVPDNAIVAGNPAVFIRNRV